MPKPIVFICNSETDGFREGDGDLMDKMTIHLNNLGFEAIRIIMYKQDIASDRKEQEGNRIICLEEKRLPLNQRRNYNIKNYQKRLLDIVCAEKYADREKILYIGSRLDCAVVSTSMSNDWGSLRNAVITKTLFNFLDNKTLKYAKEVSKNWHIMSKTQLDAARLIKVSDNNYVIEEVLLKQSGALFDKGFIKILKQQGLKIVICCLEYKFFFRSKASLRIAYEMLDQQLFLADAIQFLTKKDKEYFELTLGKLQTDTALNTLDVNKLVFENENEKVAAKKELSLAEVEKRCVDFAGTEFEQLLKDAHWIQKQKEKGFYSAGIYTVDPLNNIQLYELVKRPKNIVQFGMIRAEKGIDESLELARELENIAYNKLFIIGRVREMPILRHLIMSCFKCTIRKFTNVKVSVKFSLDIITCEEEVRVNTVSQWKASNQDNQANKHFILINVNGTWYLDKGDMNTGMYKLSEASQPGLKKLGDYLANEPMNNIMAQKEEVLEKILGILGIKRWFSQQREQNIDLFMNAVKYAYSKVTNEAIPDKVLANIDWNIKEHVGMDGFNEFAEHLLTYCKNNLELITKNVEVYFNMSEEVLRDFAMKNCRYAIKLDHKGMAENASSIVSCLGLYLPVFTTQGYLSSEEFLAGGKYEQVVILADNQYHLYVDPDHGINEVRPKIPQLHWICNTLASEDDEIYLSRLSSLFELHKEAVFSSERMAKQLEDTFIKFASNLAPNVNLNFKP